MVAFRKEMIVITERARKEIKEVEERVRKEIIDEARLYFKKSLKIKMIETAKNGNYSGEYDEFTKNSFFDRVRRLFIKEGGDFLLMMIHEMNELKETDIQFEFDYRKESIKFYW
jgi:hypothetical protein